MFRLARLRGNLILRLGFNTANLTNKYTIYEASCSLYTICRYQYRHYTSPTHPNSTHLLPQTIYAINLFSHFPCYVVALSPKPFFYSILTSTLNYPLYTHYILPLSRTPRPLAKNYINICIYIYMITTKTSAPSPPPAPTQNRDTRKYTP